MSLREKIIDFDQLFIIIGLIVAPTLLFFAHKVLLLSMSIVTDKIFVNTTSIMNNIFTFFIVNALVIFSLCLYVISISPLSLRYRGEKIDQILSSLKVELIDNGKYPVTAVAHSFALFGILPFVIPTASLLPGGPKFGIFSIIYSIIIILCFFIIWGKQHHKTKDSN